MTAARDVQLARRRQIEAVGRDAGTAVVVCYTSGARSIGTMDTVWYATGVLSVGAAAAVLHDGERVLLVSPAYDAARASLLAPDWKVEGVDDVIEALAGGLSRFGRGSLGFCGSDQLTASAGRQLGERLGREWVDLGASVQAATVASDEAKIEAARQATRAAEEGYARILDMVRPGVREFELVAELDHAIRDLGGEDNFLLMAASQHPTSVHGPGDRVLCEGDLLLAEISPCIDGVFAQICRTVVLGSPSPALVEGFQLVHDGFEAGLAACKPGRKVGEVVAAVNEPIARAGFGEYCGPPYMRTRGHGMGFASPRPQELSRDSSEEIVEGMVFVLHPNQYLPTVGYLMCGDSVVVGRDGAELLGSRPARLDVAAV